MEANLKKIKWEMQRQGMTHQALADKIGKRRQVVGYYLKHGPKSLRVIDNIAKALGFDDAKDLII